MQWFIQDVNIGKNLRSLREQLMGSNMSRSTYSKIETGNRNIRISDFLALKQIYDVDFSEFFVGLLPEENTLL